MPFVGKSVSNGPTIASRAKVLTPLASLIIWIPFVLWNPGPTLATHAVHPQTLVIVKQESEQPEVVRDAPPELLRRLCGAADAVRWGHPPACAAAAGPRRASLRGSSGVRWADLCRRPSRRRVRVRLGRLRPLDRVAGRAGAGLARTHCSAGALHLSGAPRAPCRRARRLDSRGAVGTRFASEYVGSGSGPCCG